MSVQAELKNIIEAALLAAGRPLSLEAMQALFPEIECPDRKELRAALETLVEDYQGRGIEIAEVSSGWRIQVRAACSPWVSRLWDERPARYSRALMETLALIAYRQPITRGEIEDIRGVSVSTNIIKTLMEREWVRVVGQRDVPGRPSLYATTREFLDYFGLKSLDELPTLAELRDLDEINRELDLSDPDAAVQAAGSDDNESTAAETGDLDSQEPDAEGVDGGAVADTRAGEADSAGESVVGPPAGEAAPQALGGEAESADAVEVETAETPSEGDPHGVAAADEPDTVVDNATERP